MFLSDFLFGSNLSSASCKKFNVLASRRALLISGQLILGAGWKAGCPSASLWGYQRTARCHSVLTYPCNHCNNAAPMPLGHKKQQ